jgi:hypothetical protein
MADEQLVGDIRHLGGRVALARWRETHNPDMHTIDLYRADLRGARR